MTTLALIKYFSKSSLCYYYNNEPCNVTLWHLPVSRAVQRGAPHASQLYLDGVLDALLERDRAAGRAASERDSVNLARVIYFCMRQRPSSTSMINGATGKTITNEEMLKLIVPLSRALVAKGASGRRVLIVMRNHEQLTSVYYASLFTGVVPLILDPLSTDYELDHFFKLVDPFLVFCDRDRLDDVTQAATRCGLAPAAFITDDELHQFSAGHSDDLDNFVVTEVAPTSPAILLPSGGSTGPGKVILLTQQALLANLATLWACYTEFPTPTKRLIILCTAQWMGYTMYMTSCPVYHITIVMSPLNRTPEHAVELIEKFRVTWVGLVPGFAKDVSMIVKPEQLVSVRTLMITGAPPPPDTIASFRNKLPKPAHLWIPYGMTEMHGLVTEPDPDAPSGSIGKISNILQYKLVDNDGEDVLGTHQNGELYLKSDICLTKGYLNNEDAYRESVAPGGWWKTGDVVYKDENDYFYFVHRTKFRFRCPSTLLYIAPEELESVISSVAGVRECVACGSEDGAAAAVVVQPGCDVTRERVHAAVNSTLAEYKRLRGGIAFVDSLPRNHSGKLRRMDCNKMVYDLIKSGQCF